MNTLIFIIGLYLVFIPLMIQHAFNEQCLSFLKFYFTPNPDLNTFAFIVFIILGSGALLWYSLFMFIIKPLACIIIIVLEFLFKLLFVVKGR